MSASIRVKKKPIILTKASSPNLQNKLVRPQLPFSSTYTEAILTDQTRDAIQTKDFPQTSRGPQKTSRLINLQIPSLASGIIPNLKSPPPNSKPVSSKSVKSPRATMLKKKKQAELDIAKSQITDHNILKADKSQFEELSEGARGLEKELQNLMEENLKLKSKIKVGNVSDEYIEELMANFKKRVQKILEDD